MVVMPSNRRWSLRAANLDRINKKLKELTEQKELLSNQLKEMCGYKSTQCGRWVYFKEERKGNIDYGSIPLLKSIDLELYRKEDVAIWKLKSTNS